MNQPPGTRRRDQRPATAADLSPPLQEALARLPSETLERLPPQTLARLLQAQQEQGSARKTVWGAFYAILWIGAAALVLVCVALVYIFKVDMGFMPIAVALFSVFALVLLAKWQSGHGGNHQPLPWQKRYNGDGSAVDDGSGGN
ncbi:MAG: hypothetical protein LBP52_03450 [Burkholderiaceae bacterium]|jgi:hypothetical protein|nr:hypothetical protein [Burkholderiaceae bacterium]